MLHKPFSNIEGMIRDVACFLAFSDPGCSYLVQPNCKEGAGYDNIIQFVMKVLESKVSTFSDLY